ncbi:hypothetical protein XELAEV_18043004mg [Xenopus laevis]|uniref:Uncharacterized protein n=1 Tax=Xenopus laevis TaxID=8355 RepID=A0A974H6J9_XENLA|nr:hypothetical protein XELAEV_18043004mg [Xenopus laevis]
MHPFPLGSSTEEHIQDNHSTRTEHATRHLLTSVGGLPIRRNQRSDQFYMENGVRQVQVSQDWSGSYPCTALSACVFPAPGLLSFPWSDRNLY